MRYKTQRQAAKLGIVTPEMALVAQKENRDEAFILEGVKNGTIAIPANVEHKCLSAEGVGSGLKTKINVNLGISGDCIDYTDGDGQGENGGFLRRRGHYGPFQLWQDA